MGSADFVLPLSTSPDLTLVVPTPNERLECLRINGQSWRGRMSPEEYIGRENHLMSQDMTRDGALTCWILTDRNSPPDSRPILSSCETFLKDAFLAYNGSVEDILAHGIGSVFSRPEYRGRGYAKRMILELAHILDTWQLESTTRKKSVFSVLYSDIGKSFYAALGWKPFQSSHYSLAPIRKQTSANSESLDMTLVKDMTRDDVERYMCADAVLEGCRSILKEASTKDSKAKVAFRPDFNHMTWHWAREEFYVKTLLQDKGEPKVKGAGVPSRNVFVSWNRNFGTAKEQTLFILRTLYKEPSSPSERQTTVDAIAAVLRRAQYEADEWGLSQVEIWNPTSLIEEAVKQLDSTAELVHRESKGITSLKWNGKELGLGEEVDWVWNEKYGWC
ncbi:hypothetical protein LOZ53_004147 [Ophidiomyces ophidiicola]|nr:hypothetical protein LOZ61_002170 [Ophidiomyces ophidiicola]KAI1923247.1 hypothetical protein LOZ60_005324 [Ophidiomyces ophidiicola]KAI1973128.1 hypothetical protein LOZ55_005553 [Ophidiomyces ophidiicola]KAI1987779.1 hypothetical protein LOZ53_004147 [Ophidiomyces ophidiicola]KAI1989461.1 hypothetical protein LOZ54_002871 [Ophidiomyces ophidiicola]